jgi:hypothetical protein
LREKKIFLFFMGFVRTQLDEANPQGVKEGISQSSQSSQPDNSAPGRFTEATPKRVLSTKNISDRKTFYFGYNEGVWRSYERMPMAAIARQRDFRFFFISPESRVHNLNRQRIRGVHAAG